MKIKIISILLFVLTFLTSFSQKSFELQQHYDQEFKTFKEFMIRNTTFKGDTNIDVKFYHLDIEIGVLSPSVRGNVKIRFTPVTKGLNTLRLNLNSALTVENISAPCESFYQDNDEIVVQLDENYNPGDLIDLKVYYHGVPVLAGGYKGLRYESHGSGEPIIATLSTPYLAHYWYPCKDGPEDKADSVYIDITIPELSYNGIELMAVSNGVLENVIDNGDTKTFEWRHRYPIVTYYVMAAISNYVVFQEQFNGTAGESYPLIYYVFDEDLAQSQQGVQEMPDAIQFFSDTYGIYPFSNEKYGMTQLGFYGAIENQTNTITNNMRSSWIYISVHELAHMWFGDNITCNNWHHAWLNEGFATYSEALWEEHKYGFGAYKSYIANEEYWNSGTLYLENAQDTFNIFQSIIYSKGSYTLHMLRGVLGDNLFFEALHDYATSPRFMYGNATTEDLQEVFENTSGMDLGFFFEQWVYDELYPKYFYNYYQNADNELGLVIYQGQEELWGYRPVFEMPIQVKFNFSGGGDTTITVWNDKQTQEFNFQFAETVSSVAIDPEKWILRKTEFDSDLTVGLSENTENGIMVFPNPFQNNLVIHVPHNISLPANVTVYNAQGKRIFSNTILKQGNTHIALENLPKGIYFYRITNKHDILIKSGKVLKR